MKRKSGTDATKIARPCSTVTTKILESFPTNACELPEITACLPVYNGEKFLARTIESLLAQDYPNVRILISDNASNDATEDICRNYAGKYDRIEYTRNTTNIGPGPNADKLVRMCTSPFLLWASDHDIWHPNFISRLIPEILANDEILLVYARTVIIDVTDTVIEHAPDILDTRGLNRVDRFAKIMREYTWGNMNFGIFRTNALRRTSERSYNVVGPDHVIMVRLSLEGSIAQIDEPLFYRRRKRPEEDADKSRVRQINWYVSSEFERVVAMTMMAYEHVNVIRESDLTAAEKEFLYNEVRECFPARFAGSMQNEAFTLITKGQAALSDLTYSPCSLSVTAHELLRLTAICRYFYPTHPDLIRFQERLQTLCVPMLQIAPNRIKGQTHKLPGGESTSARRTAPSVSFIIIVLNGMPFIEPALQAIYDIAHEVIVIEGAVEKCMFAANPDGSSVDGTVEFLRRFPDPAGKLKLIHGIWPEKCEMQNAALEHVTGEYVWLVDSDEVYHKEDLKKIVAMLAADPSITQMNFIPDNFWKGYKFLFVHPCFFETPHHYRRLFKFVPGARFITHRPPTMVWPGESRTTEQINLVDGTATRKMGIYPYHYSYVLDSQVRQKIELYHRYGWGEGWGVNMDKWYQEFYLRWTPENSKELERLYPIWTGDPNSYSVPFTGRHPEVMQDFLVNKPSSSIAGDRPGLRIAGEGTDGKDLTQIQEGSEFETRLNELVTTIRPRKIIETGTYLGTGTTRIIASALKSSGISNARFYTIECDPNRHQQAVNNLTGAGLHDYVTPLCGLSVPRSLLPSIEQIRCETVENVERGNIYVDHQEENRVAFYHGETNFPDITDDLIGKCLVEFDGNPDMILLDSAGHMGYVEFNYVINRLYGECHIVLDDIKHIKHHRSFQKIKTDPRFTLLTASDEKFGFCIARFTPSRLPLANDIRKILWIRTDSIGDAVLAMSMLPHVKEKYPQARITVLCQDHIAELYETCPHTDNIITFNRSQSMNNEEYRQSILNELQAVQADICINSVYSRDVLSDYFALSSGSGTTIALNGDISNMSAKELTIINEKYTLIIPSPGQFRQELQRHRDLLSGLEIKSADLDLSLPLTESDFSFADKILALHGLVPNQTIILFAGAQYEVRLYDHYGEALSNLCKENGFSVVALGTSKDFIINQRNLRATGVRCVNLSGKLSLRQSAALISRCRLAVGAETGLAHIACAVNTPNIILLGGGHFGRFMPYSPLTSAVSLPLECFGCNWKCRYNQTHCIRGIRPEVLSEAILETLYETYQSPRIFVQSASSWQPGAGIPNYADIGGWANFTSAKIIGVS